MRSKNLICNSDSGLYKSMKWR